MAIEPRFFVVGGFHAEGLKRLLKRAGQSYVLVMPRVKKNSRKNEL